MIPYILEAEFFLRIVLASVCGILIGFERSKRLKEAGVRTHCMVACGAALMMIVSKYGFADLVQEAGVYLYGTKGADASRIASQVVSGVGFLGAGVIFRTGVSIKGLTTAAGLWTTSAVGLALGAGMYIIGITGTLLIVLEQFFDAPIPLWKRRLHHAGDQGAIPGLPGISGLSLPPSTRAGRQYLQLRREQDGRWRCGLYLDRPGQGTHQRPGAAGADGPA